MFRYALSIACLCFCCSCVEHRGMVSNLQSDAYAGKNIQLFKDGRLTENLEPSFTSTLPSEMHVDAWYRDEQGLIYRSHLHVLSPRPWWQRFPADLFTDALWPKTISIEASGSLQFKAIESLEPGYLDQLAEAHGYGKNYIRSE